MQQSVLTLPAFAKINLGLRVLGKRADGYHEIDTIFQTISLHDTIKISKLAASDVILSCDNRSLPTGSHNLVVRAARALQKRFAIDKGARIRLEKRIPTHAGLGGGSADAAITLLGLMRLWDLDPEKEQIHRIATELGADVPFFLQGGAARGTGIGNQIEPLESAPEKYLLIIKPNANTKTANAYDALRKPALTSKVTETILSRSDARGFFSKQNLGSLQNDFEAVAFVLRGEIKRSKAALTNAGAHSALLAGSGSAVFGIFDSEDAQRRAIQTIELETGWRVFPCKTVGREQYVNALEAVGDILRRFTGE